LNPEGKQRWNILKNQHHLTPKELEDWGHCLIIQQNVDENSSTSPEVLCHGYSYIWFVTCIKWTNIYYVPPKKEKKKMENVPIVREQNSNIIPNINVNNNNNNGDNCSSNPSDFVTSSSFVPSTPFNIITDSSTNVVSTTTPSFVPSEIEIELTIPSHYYSPSISITETSDSPSHTPLSNDDVAAMYNNLIRGAQAVAKQGDK
jgi:cytoskeletal protein RodZ